jgi:hypothetical protein
MSNIDLYIFDNDQAQIYSALSLVKTKTIIVDRCDHRLNMELNLQSLFGRLFTVVLLG